jgi:MoxR-like ATPase
MSGQEAVRAPGFGEEQWDGAVAHQALEIEGKPYYLPLGDEVIAFEAAYRNRLPVMLKGPTGCGKTRFVRHMAHRLGRPLVSVACHDDLTASDLIGASSSVATRRSGSMALSPRRSARGRFATSTRSWRPAKIRRW